MAKKRPDPAPPVAPASPTGGDVPPAEPVTAHIVEQLRPLAVPIAQLVPDPANARTHDERNLDAIRGSLAAYGQRKPVVVNRRTNVVEAGNGTLRAALALGWTHVAAVFVDDDPVTATGFAIADNRTAELAGWDEAALQKLLAEVEGPNAELTRMLDDLAESFRAELEEPGGGAGGDEFDATPEEQGPTRTAVGDLWVIGGKHRLLVGDCTVPENVTRLMGGGKADLIVADPPYGVDFKRGQFITDPSRRSSRTRGVGDEIANDDRKADDQEAFMRTVFSLLRQHSRPACSVYMWSATLAEGSHSMLGLAAAGVHIQTQLVWVKNNLVLGIADYHWKHEICWYGWYEGAAHRWFGERDKTSVLEFARVQSTEHPNAKPVDLIAHLIRNSSQAGELVLDPFLGSGTGLIAAHRLGRACYGCEIDPRYADLILRRAEAEGLTCEKAS